MTTETKRCEVCGLPVEGEECAPCKDYYAREGFFDFFALRRAQGLRARLKARLLRLPNLLRGTSFFGRCPECWAGTEQLYLYDVNRYEWMGCRRCRTCWLWAWSSTNEVDAAETAYNRRVLTGFREVKPVYIGGP